jgi:hypothetical protein
MRPLAAAASSTSGADPWAESITGADIVYEHDALAPELLYHQAVVHDLVVAVDRRLEDAHHPRERLDSHLDPGAEASRLGEQDELDVAGLRLDELLSSRCHGRPG